MKYILSKKSGQLYLTEYDIFKLNYNCPESEKTGSGKGSCGGDSDKDISEDRMVTVDKIEVDAMNGKFGDKGSLVIMTTRALRSMIADKSFNSSVKGSDINGLISIIVSKNPKSVKDAVTIARKVSPKSYFEKDNIPEDRIKKSPVPGSKVGPLSSPKSLTASQKDKLTKLGVNPSKYKVARIDNGSGKQIPIIAPITMFEDKKIQNVTENIPSGLMTKVSSITFSDGRNSEDSSWSERFGRKFTSGGNCNRHKGIVTLFGSDMKSVNSLKQILYHELGHTLDKSNKLSYSKEYGDAVREDTKNGHSYASFGGMGFVSEYAKASAEVYAKLDQKRDQRCEDFADATEMYTNRPETFSVQYPARYKYFKKLFGD